MELPYERCRKAEDRGLATCRRYAALRHFKRRLSTGRSAFGLAEIAARLGVGLPPAFHKLLGFLFSFALDAEASETQQSVEAIRTGRCRCSGVSTAAAASRLRAREFSSSLDRVYPARSNQVFARPRFPHRPRREQPAHAARNRRALPCYRNADTPADSAKYPPE